MGVWDWLRVNAKENLDGSHDRTAAMDWELAGGHLVSFKYARSLT